MPVSDAGQRCAVLRLVGKGWRAEGGGSGREAGCCGRGVVGGFLRLLLVYRSGPPSRRHLWDREAARRLVWEKGARARAAFPWEARS